MVLDINTNGKTVKVDVSNLETGMYSISVQSANGFTTQKIFIQ
jgi:hypothetical protein